MKFRFYYLIICLLKSSTFLSMFLSTTNPTPNSPAPFLDHWQRVCVTACPLCPSLAALFPVTLQCQACTVLVVTENIFWPNFEQRSDVPCTEIPILFLLARSSSVFQPAPRHLWGFLSTYFSRSEVFNTRRNSNLRDQGVVFSLGRRPRPVRHGRRYR